MKHFRINVTDHAKEDLRGIVHYISDRLQERATAQRIYQRIRNEIRELDHMPERYPLWEDEPWRSQGVRKMLVGGYQVLYQVDRTRCVVMIARIMYAGRDIAGQLSEMDFQTLMPDGSPDKS